ncbi:MAG: glutathione S-transferase [Geminicoccaceae bacterium]
MRLYHSQTSPYVRKVMVVAREAGIHDRIELIAASASPVGETATVASDNPLGKLPCLLLDDGGVLYDSQVICEYLDSLHDGHKLFPAPGPARWQALRRQSLGDGICDAALLRRYETFQRPPERRWDEWMLGQKGKVGRALDALEAEIASFPAAPNIGSIAVAVALAYLDLRFAEEPWRDGRPRLAEWHAGFATRPSMRETAPPPQ